MSRTSRKKESLKRNIDPLRSEAENLDIKPDEKCIEKIKNILTKSTEKDRFPLIYAIISNKVMQTLPKEKYYLYHNLAKMECSNASLPRRFTFHYGAVTRPRLLEDIKEDISSFFANKGAISTIEKSLKLLHDSRINEYSYKDETCQILGEKRKELESLLATRHKDYVKIAQMIITIGQDTIQETLGDERLNKKLLINNISRQLEQIANKIDRIQGDESAGKSFIVQYLKESPQLVTSLSESEEEITKVICNSTSIIEPLAKIMESYYRDTPESLATKILLEKSPNTRTANPSVNQKDNKAASAIRS